MIFALLRMIGKAQPLAHGDLVGRSGAMAWKYRSLPISNRLVGMTATLFRVS